MSNKRFFFIFLFYLFCIPIKSQDYILTADTRSIHSVDSIIILKKKPWKATLETVGFNLALGTFNRYALKKDYAQVNFSSIKSNFQTGFVWDNDRFATNMFGHPYEGGIYFSAARTNGLNFYESMPYALGGSLMWEFFMETDPPAINDLITTTVGGFSLGETTYRLSDLIIDSRTTGWERFGREFLATAICPINGLNRILNGDAWKKRNFKGRSFEELPVRVALRSSYKALKEKSDIFNGISSSMYLDASLIYGNPFSCDEQGPYNYFSFKAGANLISDKQPLLSNVNAIGLILGKEIEMKKESREMILGIFQHFDYYDSYGGEYNGSGGVSKEGNHYYRISEAAAFGGGMLYQSKASKNNAFFIAIHVNAILLGGSLTDYYNDIDRDYNMGSGYSNKLKAGMLLKSQVGLALNFENYHIFTWKGYDPNVDLSQLSYEDQLFLNAQGDKGNARLSLLTLSLNYKINKHLDLYTDLSYYYRKSKYVYHDNISYSVKEGKIGLGYLF